VFLPQTAYRYEANIAMKTRNLKKRARRLVGASVQAGKRGARKVAAHQSAGAAAAAMAALAMAARSVKRTLARRKVRQTVAGAGKTAATAAIVAVLELALLELRRKRR
jgi:hypothetical protein